jgi:dihydrolipoamide dehydrogenase
MNAITVDVAIIGAGTAGLAAYRAARARNARAVLIEAGPYGTTCARVGCMPSKLLIAAAEASHAIDEAHGFGVHVDGVKRVDGHEVMARVKRERDRFVGFVLESVESIPAADRILGRARFIDRETLDVDAHTRITARAIVVATGSRPDIAPILKGLGDRLVVNDDVFSWDTLPKSVAVFGPGVIGLEIGQALSRLGVRVVVLGRSGSVGTLSDPVVRQAAIEAFTKEFELVPQARVERVERIGNEVEVTYQANDGTKRTEKFEYALAASGRRPNIDGIGLDTLGLELDQYGAPVSDGRTMQVGPTNLFIAGDSADEFPLLHEAADEGRIAGDNAARYPAVVPGLRRAPLAVVFTDPQIAIVGRGFGSLTPGRFAIGAVSFEDQGRSRVMLKNRGHLRVYAEIGSGRFLGAEMAGPSAEHIGHLLAWALQNEMTVARMLEMPFYHPVVEEGLRTALRDLDASLRAPRSLAA